MKILVLIPSFIALLLVVGAFPTALAVNSRPWHGSLSGSFTLTSQTTATSTYTGHESHLGKITGTGTSTTIGSSECGGFTAKQQETETAANGDAIFESNTSVFCPTSNPNVDQITVFATVTGGTGRFADASGSATAHGTVTMTSPTGGTFSVTFEGTIAY